MDSGNSVAEVFCVSTCENLNNAHVHEFISRVGIAKTATELMSFERCPVGLNNSAFKYPLNALKTHGGGCLRARDLGHPHTLPLRVPKTAPKQP